MTEGSGLAGQLRGSALFVLSPEDHISFPRRMMVYEKVWTEWLEQKKMESHGDKTAAQPAFWLKSLLNCKVPRKNSSRALKNWKTNTWAKAPQTWSSAATFNLPERLTDWYQIQSTSPQTRQINVSWTPRVNQLWSSPADPKLPSFDLNVCAGNYKAAIHRETFWSTMFANQRAALALLL